MATFHLSSSLTSPRCKPRRSEAIFLLGRAASQPGPRSFSLLVSALDMLHERHDTWILPVRETRKAKRVLSPRMSRQSCTLTSWICGIRCRDLQFEAFIGCGICFFFITKSYLILVCFQSINVTSTSTCRAVLQQQ